MLYVTEDWNTTISFTPKGWAALASVDRVCIELLRSTGEIGFCCPIQRKSNLHYGKPFSCQPVLLLLSPCLAFQRDPGKGWTCAHCPCNLPLGPRAWEEGSWIPAPFHANSFSTTPRPSPETSPPLFLQPHSQALPYHGTLEAAGQPHLLWLEAQ